MTDTTPASDAKNRALRTLIQGGIVTALIALATVVATIVGTWTGDDVLTAGSWVTLGTSALTTVLTSVASYVAGHVAPPK
jgi:hypothetical protein